MSNIPRSLDELLDLAPGYVFGGLDADELAAFEQAMASPEHAAALAAEVAALRVATEAMVQATAVTPPPALREKLQARIAVEAGTQTAAQVAGEVASRVATPTSSTPVTSAPAVAAASATSLPFGTAPAVAKSAGRNRAVRVTPPRGAAADDLARRRRPSRAGWYATALVSAGLAATVIFALDLRNRITVLEAETREKTARVARLEAKLSDKERTLTTLLAGRGNVLLVNLDASVPTGPGMQVFWNVREGKAVVNAYGLAQVATDRAYMLWMIRDGQPVPVKLFTPDETGRALVVDVPLPNTTTGITLLAVTEESAQGAEAPTMTPFLAGTVATK